VGTSGPRELAGYRADSPWPGEDGGPLRRQAADSRHATGADRWSLTASRTAPLACMVVTRDPGELYLLGHTLGPDSTSWLERIDPEHLGPVARSPELAGGPFWPGGVAAHANGDLYVTYGRWCHRLDPDCRPVAARELPAPRPYNSLVVLPDGHLVMKDFGGGEGAQALPAGDACEVLVLEPAGLEIVARHRLPEGSIARLSLRLGDGDGADEVVVVGDTHLFRLAWDPTGPGLAPCAPPLRYRTHPGQGFGWDATVVAGAAWFLDDGEGTEGFGGCFHGRGVATAPLRLWRADLAAGALAAREVCGLPGGIIANPPVVDPARGIAVAYDSGNGVLAGFAIDDDGFVSDAPKWHHNQDQAGHMVLFTDTGVLASFDFDRDRAVDQVVLRDIASGDERDRVDTTSPVQHVVFPAVGWSGELYTTSFTTLSRLDPAAR
jgi:hypothetical protein